MKSETAAASYKEASAGITHSQKLLCSPECMQIVGSQIQVHPDPSSSSSESPQTQTAQLHQTCFSQWETEGDAGIYIF